MKSKITLLACSMLLGMPLAQAGGSQGDVKIDHFPDRAPAMEMKSPAAKVVTQGLNDEKALGIKMWATTVTDYFKDPGFVYFYENKTNELHKTGIIKSREEDELRRWLMSSATYHEGSYIGFFYYSYDLGYNYPQAFAKINLENGTWETLADLSNLKGDWDFMESMSTNPVDGKLMGMARARDGSVTSTFGEVNAATGEYTKKAALSQYYYAIAYDASGTLWALRWYSSDNKTLTGSRLVTLNPGNGYKEDKVIKLTMEGADFKMYFQNSMYFDVETGDLWVLAADNQAHQYLCRVDTATGVMEKRGRIGYFDICTGLYIPGTKPASANAASRVTNLSSSFDDNGIVTLRWTNPSTTWDKQPLNQLAEVLVYRDGMEASNLVATLNENVIVGGDMSWTDNDAAHGVHTYYIVPCRVNGEKGISDSWKAFTGRDVPGRVENITLTKNNRSSLTLSWEQPSLGMNDGWYDKANVTYDVVRYPDSTVVATGIAETTLTDTELGLMGSYYYKVKAHTGDGEGPEAESPAVMAGFAYNLPYSTKFETQAEADQWEKVDANGDGRTFIYKNYMDPWGLYITSSDRGNDDYAISPSLNLKGGKTYKVTFHVYFHYCATDREPDHAQTFSITAGKGATAEAQVIELKKWENFQHYKYYETFTFEAFFKPESDGEYNVAYRYFDSPVYDDITVSYASIEEVFDKDLAALSVEGNADVVKDAASDFAVKVKNEGSEDAKNFSVKVVRLDGDNKVLLGETAFKGTLAANADTIVTVATTPDIEGEFQIAGVVALAGDRNTANDMTEAILVKAASAGTKPFNLDITGDYPAVNTRIPVSFMKTYSHTQAIYTAEELKDTKTIYRLAFEYDSNPDSKTALDEIDMDVTVYLGLTDDAGYPLQGPEWKPLADQTKVFEGTLGLQDGSNNMLTFDLNEPFRYDRSKNLLVTVLKSSPKYGEDFPVFFKMFNENWNATDYRSMLFDSNVAQEARQGDGYSYPCLPVLHLAVETEGSGVNSIVAGSGISYDGAAIHFAGIDAAAVEVYDLMGRMVLGKSISSHTTSVSAPLAQGVYVMKVTDRNGKAYTTKVCVAQ